MERWATFDCYGTLIDWNGGIGRELERLFGAEQRRRAAAPLPRARAGAPARGSDAELPRGDDEALARLGAPAGEEDALAGSLPDWEPFPEVPAALDGGARARLEARDPLEHRPRLHRRVASRGSASRSTRRSSRPRSARTSRRTATGDEFFARTGADRARTSTSPRASSTTSRPRSSSACRTVWINRLGEAPEPAARRRAAHASTASPTPSTRSSHERAARHTRGRPARSPSCSRAVEEALSGPLGFDADAVRRLVADGLARDEHAGCSRKTASPSPRRAASSRRPRQLGRRRPARRAGGADSARSSLALAEARLAREGADADALVAVRPATRAPTRSSRATATATCAASGTWRSS